MDCSYFHCCLPFVPSSRPLLSWPPPDGDARLRCATFPTKTLNATSTQNDFSGDSGYGTCLIAHDPHVTSSNACQHPCDDPCLCGAAPASGRGTHRIPEGGDGGGGFHHTEILSAVLPCGPCKQRLLRPGGGGDDHGGPRVDLCGPFRSLGGPRDATGGRKGDRGLGGQKNT